MCIDGTLSLWHTSLFLVNSRTWQNEMKISEHHLTCVCVHAHAHLYVYRAKHGLEYQVHGPMTVNTFGSAAPGIIFDVEATTCATHPSTQTHPYTRTTTHPPTHPHKRTHTHKHTQMYAHTQKHTNVTHKLTYIKFMCVCISVYSYGTLLLDA